MYPWILLKITPAFSNFIGLPDVRHMVYFILALLVLLSLIMKYTMLRESKPDRSFFILVILFFMVLLLNAGDQYITTSSKAETFLLARSLFLIITLSMLLKYNTGKSLLLYSLLLYFSLIQILSALNYLNIINSLFVLSDIRNMGIMSSTFSLSYSSVISAGILLIYLEHCKSGAIRISAYFMLITCIINCFFSVSRISIAGIGLIGLFWLLEMARKSQNVNSRKTFRKYGSLLAVALVCGMFYCTLLKDNHFFSYGYGLWKMRMGIFLSEGIKGQESRWLTNSAGVKLFLQHPLTGVGWDNAASLAMEYGTTMNSTAHNVFIQAASEGGILGIAFSILLFFIIPYKFFVKYRHVPGSYIFMGTWFSVIFYNMIASNLHLEAHWDALFFWMVLTSLFEKKYTVENR